MLPLQQVLNAWIKPALDYLPSELNTPARRQMVLGIGVVETAYSAMWQDGGPALGFWQIQPNTWHDIHVNYLIYRPKLSDSIKKLLKYSEESIDLLTQCPRYAALLCALIVYRSPLALPAYNDSEAQARFWLEAYNCGGAGTMQRALPCFQSVQNLGA